MDPARLLLVRHGATAGNAADGRLLMGSTDLPLTVEGIRQARALARGLGVRPFEAIVSSPLQRAAATAREIAVLHPTLPLGWSKEIQEMDCGRLDGLHVEIARSRYPEIWEANQRQDDQEFRWPGGESYRELRERVVAGCDRIAAERPGATVVVVTHAGVVGQLLGHLEGLSPARWEPHRPRHCTVTEIAWGRGEGRLVAFDQAL